MAEQLRSEQFMQQALDSWGGAVYRLALSHTRCAADAQDIAQDAFLSLLKSTVLFNDDEHVKAWLLHVTANRCREYHRSAWKRKVDTTDNLEPLADRAVGDSALDELTEHPVWTALAQLPEKLREVVHLHYIEGYPTDSIAKILDVHPATVRTRLFRARKQLRDVLDPEPRATREKKGVGRETQSF